jgi:hypothetical protein
MTTSESDISDFGAYIEVAKSFNEKKKLDLVSSKSIRLVTGEKDLFDPYPWIPSRSKLGRHPLDPYSANTQTTPYMDCFLSCSCCERRLNTINEACDRTPSYTTQILVLVYLLIFVIVVFYSSSGD